MEKTIVINLIGAPCAGKSTLAALVFSKLKMEGLSCEIVTEFAKDLVWNNSLNSLNNQLYVFSEQFYRIWRLKNKVDIVITDSPMILSIFYNMRQKEENKLPENLLNPLIMHCHNMFYNINYFVKNTHQYDKVGRKQTMEEALAMEKDMKELYKNLNIDFTEIECNEKYASFIVTHLKNILKKYAK